jgi:hypothetical protein
MPLCSLTYRASARQGVNFPVHRRGTKTNRFLMKRTASRPVSAAPQNEAAPAGKLGRVPAMRRNRPKGGAQDRAGLVGGPDAAPAQPTAGPMQEKAGAGHRQPLPVGNNTAHKTPFPESQDPETGVRGAFDYATIGMALVAPNGRWSAMAAMRLCISSARSRIYRRGRRRKTHSSRNRNAPGSRSIPSATQCSPPTWRAMSLF